MERVIFKRKLYQRMLFWKEESKGSTALLIRGARRVGKSTLAEDFARREYKNFIIIDFAHISKEVNSLFDDISDIDFFFFRLQTLTNVSLERRQSCIIFDEIQLQPKARQAIKYLVADGRYDYIETGSLLSIKKNVKGIVIPSEETRLNLYPMDYEEFRWALGDEVSIQFIREAFVKHLSLGDDVNRKLMRNFRLYMVIGGMPQAVNKYLETNDLSKVDEVKRSIIDLYDDDFHKIDATGRASMMFKAIPGELSRNATRYAASNATGETHSERLLETIGNMLDSMTINIAYHANDPSVGLSLHKDIERYKMFVGDTGLFVTLAFLDKDFSSNSLYIKLLSDKLSADLGYVYENAIAQMLHTAGNELFYYTFKKESSNHYNEVDFLLSRNEKVCPLEVKSSGYQSHASLDEFYKKYPSRVSERYLVYTKDFRKQDGIFYIPAYMAWLI